ncbi:hypothetical protein D9C73_025727 [Collichthys lucidus]|uniref:Uncharacterized protein n=1 Tax=Collichthys lucidus TaxID=240159 RepID=A0A4V6AUQ2_COLLU|nr:hypothetical protein D9C73_025727 [Collichthys lucidus]
MQAGEGPSEGGPPLNGAIASWATAQTQPKLEARWTGLGCAKSSSLNKQSVNSKSDRQRTDGNFRWIAGSQSLPNVEIFTRGEGVSFKLLRADRNAKNKTAEIKTIIRTHKVSVMTAMESWEDDPGFQGQQAKPCAMHSHDDGSGKAGEGKPPAMNAVTGRQSQSWNHRGINPEKITSFLQFLNTGRSFSSSKMYLTKFLILIMAVPLCRGTVVENYEKNISCNDIKTTAGFKFPHNGSERSEIFVTCNKTAIAHALLANQSFTYLNEVISMDNYSVITRECQDLEIKCIVPDGTFVKEIIIYYRITVTPTITEPPHTEPCTELPSNAFDTRGEAADLVNKRDFGQHQISGCPTAPAYLLYSCEQTWDLKCQLDQFNQ